MKNELHDRFCKAALFQDISLEHELGEYKTDIFLKNKRLQSIAVTCHNSSITVAEFRKKTAYYSYQEVFNLWIFTGDVELDKCLIKLIHSPGSRLRYDTNELQRKCHRWYYGKIYYFYRGKIYAIHFHPLTRWQPGSCDECLQQDSCGYVDRRQCPQYREGYFRSSKTLREISVYHVEQLKIMCVLRKDRLRIAKFNEPAWWKI